MPRQITTRTQVSGYRFGLARAEHALVRRDARMLHDPMRAQFRALLVGAVLAALAVAGAGIYGVIRPAPAVGDARILSDGSGALYVLVDETGQKLIHPVPNLASARLVVGAPDEVKTVSAAALAELPRGPSLGVPGAPIALPGPHGGQSRWTVCDDPAAGTAVVSGPVATEQAPPDAGALVRAGDTDWLIYQQSRNGRTEPVRARIDTGSVALRRVLGLDGGRPRPISEALLNTFAAEDDLAEPVVDGRGGPSALDAVPAGTVVRTVAVDGGASYFVAFPDGLQPVGPLAAELLRAVDAEGASRVREVPPATVTGVPVVERLALSGFPETVPRLAGESAVLCWSWARIGADPVPRTSLLATTGLPLPKGAQVVALTAADGEGPGLDGVYVRPGTAEYVALAGPRSTGRRGAGGGARYLVTDAGVAHPVVGDDTASMLGLPPDPGAAPGSVIALLPAGPALSRDAALVARDLPR